MAHTEKLANKFTCPNNKKCNPHFLWINPWHPKTKRFELATNKGHPEAFLNPKHKRGSKLRGVKEKKAKGVPQILMGASSSSKLGWLMKMSLEATQSCLISDSESWTCLPGQANQTPIKQHCCLISYSKSWTRRGIEFSQCQCSISY